MSDADDFDPEINVSLKILAETHGEIHTVAIGLGDFPNLILKVTQEEDNELSFEIITGHPFDVDHPSDVADILQMLAEAIKSDDFQTQWAAKIAAERASD